MFQTEYQDTVTILEAYVVKFPQCFWEIIYFLPVSYGRRLPIIFTSVSQRCYAMEMSFIYRSHVKIKLQSAWIQMFQDTNIKAKATAAIIKQTCWN